MVSQYTMTGDLKRKRQCEKEQCLENFIILRKMEKAYNLIKSETDENKKNSLKNFYHSTIFIDLMNRNRLNKKSLNEFKNATKDVCFDPNFKDKYGTSLLNHSIRKRNIYAIIYLLDFKNIDIYAHDKNGKNALNWAKDYEYFYITNHLKEFIKHQIRDVFKTYILPEMNIPVELIEIIIVFTI